MKKNYSNDISYYLLAALGILLIILPFFFLKMTSDEVVHSVKRLTIHAATFGAAAISASALSAAVSKAAKSSTFLSSASYTVAAVATTAAIVTVVTMNTPTNTDVPVATTDSTSVSIPVADSSIAVADTIANTADSLSLSNITENTNPQITPKASFVSSSNTSEKSTASASGKPGDCAEGDVGVFMSGQKVDVSKGFSFAHRNKNIRIGDHCGCTATNTKISILDASGNIKTERTLTSPFFTLQSIGNLELSDQVSAEVGSMTCLAKDGSKSEKKLNKWKLKFIFKNDIPETQRKRAAKELFVQEENTSTGSKGSIINKASNNSPYQKDKVEEEYNKYGN